MNTKWRYGDSWEKYSIQPNEIWSHQDSGSQIMVRDIRDGLPYFMLQADMIYVDPPWSKGNINAFITKAGMDCYFKTFEDFMDTLFSCVAAIGPDSCFTEVGGQHVDDFEKMMEKIFPVVQKWNIVYYRKHPCYLIRGGHTVCTMDFTGQDDEKTPALAIEHDKPHVVADLCTGQGLTMRATHIHGSVFVGTELNKRRLAVAIDRAAKMGFHYAPLQRD